MKLPKNVIPEVPEPATPEEIKRVLGRLTITVDGHREAITKLRRAMPSDDKMRGLEEKIKRLTDIAQLSLTKGAIVSELEIMLRDAPIEKRSELFQAVAWSWDNLGDEVWRKLHIASLDVCLHRLITTFRERKH